LGFYHRKFDVKFTAFTREELTDYFAEELTYFCLNFGHLESQQVLGFYHRKFDVKFTAFTREELTDYYAEELATIKAFTPRIDVIFRSNINHSRDLERDFRLLLWISSFGSWLNYIGLLTLNGIGFTLGRSPGL